MVDEESLTGEMRTFKIVHDGVLNSSVNSQD